MPTARAVLDELRPLGTEQYRKTYARHGIPPERTFGVSNAHLKTIARSLIKTLKRPNPGELQDLALDSMTPASWMPCTLRECSPTGRR